jgi:hypothetical protein
MTRRGVVAVLALLAAACARDVPLSPLDVVAALSAALEQSNNDLSQRLRVYELLSRAGRTSLEERAARASQVSGWEVKPWEMLAPGRTRVRVPFDRSMAMVRVSGQRAVVTVRGRTGTAADVPLVYEDGRWRVDLVLPSIVTPRANEAPDTSAP